MRVKYNSKYKNIINYETSYTKKYLGEELEILLNPESNSIHDVNFRDLYVNVPGIEEYLIPFRDETDSDRCVFLTGVTGCGKSSVLQYIFPTNLNQKIVINDNSLYILFSFDHMLGKIMEESVETNFINMIKAACSELEEIIDKRHLETSDENLYEFIKNEKIESTKYGNSEEIQEKNIRLSNLRQENAIEFHVLKLKYYLSIIEKINHVIIIVDDIESLGVNKELIPINYGLGLWACLKRQTANTKKWCSSVIISCRHYVYRMIQKRSIDYKYVKKSGIDSQTLESYPIDDEINIPESVKLYKLIEKRVEALKKAKSSKRWDDAWDVVELILMRVDSTFGDFILAICINNLRKAFTVLKKIIINKRWMQRNWSEMRETPGAFVIDSIHQFNLSPPCILRAMAIGEGNIYTEDSIIPNILNNTKDKYSDLIILLTFVAFLNQADENAISWRESIDRDLIAQNIKNILQEEKTHQYVDRGIEFLIKNRLLLRSKNQAQDDGLDISDYNIKDIKYVYVTSGAFALWNQLECSSVLLELFTDDVYIDYDDDVPERQNFSLFDQVTFSRCIKFVSDMTELEYNIRVLNYNKGLINDVNSLIGDEFITKQLLKGLKVSRNKYFKTNAIFLKELLKIEDTIEEYQNYLAE